MAEETTRAPEEPLRFDGPATGAASGGGAADAPGAMRCSTCGTTIGAYYYEAGGAIHCARCKRVAEESAGAGAGPGGLGRAALYGLGAALVGAFGYWAFIKITSFDWAVVSIAVAMLVAKAIHKGNGGRAGRRFQLLAVALTYLAIGGAYAPFVIQGLIEESKQQRAVATAHGDSTASGARDSLTAPARSVSSTTAATSAPAPQSATSPDERRVSPGKAVLLLGGGVLLVALAGPVIGVIGGGFPGALINLAIIGFALRRAWLMAGAGAAATGGQVFTGPYKVAERPSSPAPGAGA